MLRGVLVLRTLRQKNVVPLKGVPFPSALYEWKTATEEIQMTRQDMRQNVKVSIPVSGSLRLLL